MWRMSQSMDMHCIACMQGPTMMCARYVKVHATGQLHTALPLCNTLLMNAEQPLPNATGAGQFVDRLYA